MNGEIEICSGKVKTRAKHVIAEQDYRRILLKFRTKQEIIDILNERNKEILQLKEIIDVIKFNVGLERKRAVEEFSKLLLANFREDESYTLIDRATVASIEKSVLKEV